MVDIDNVDLLMSSYRKSKEVLVGEDSLAPPLHVPPLKRLSESPQLSQDHDEIIQVQSPAPGVILYQDILQNIKSVSIYIDLVSDLDKCRWEVVTQLPQSLSELSTVNRAGAIPVISLEHSPPLLNVIEQTDELIDVDGATVVVVKHTDQHPGSG